MPNKFTLSFIAIILLSCGDNTLQQTNANFNSDDQTQPLAYTSKQNRSADIFRFVQHHVVDRQGTKLRAINYLIPAGWRVKDSLFWVKEDPNVPIRYAANCMSADGNMKIDIYADERTVWSHGMMRTQGVKPPVNVIAALKQIVGIYRRGIDLHYTGQQIIPQQAMPSTRRGNLTSQSRNERGYVKFEYTINGKQVEEYLFANLDINEMGTMGNSNPDAIAWSLSEVMGCAAMKGQLEACKKIALTLRASSHMTLPFYNVLAQVIQLLTNKYYGEVYAAGQLSQIISQTNDRILQTISSSYFSAQRSQDRTNRQFSDYMRGIDRYNDGKNEIQLPAGYSTAYYNNSTNEYILSQDGGNPGAGWTEMQKNN